jgi:hypothetical protein
MTRKITGAGGALKAPRDTLHPAATECGGVATS